MYMHLGDKLGPKLAEILPGLIDEILNARDDREVVVAYVPVLHEGYRRFLERHGRGRPRLPDRAASCTPTTGRWRRTSARWTPERSRPRSPAWGIARRSRCSTRRAAAARRRGRPSRCPDEDVSYLVVERYFPRAAVRYDTAFLRWDKTKTVQLLDPAPVRVVTEDQALADLAEDGRDAQRRLVAPGRRRAAASPTARSLAAPANEHHPHDAGALRGRGPAQQLLPGRRTWSCRPPRTPRRARSRPPPATAGRPRARRSTSPTSRARRARS